ncbi:MAG: hypothetical protein ABJB93_01945 [Gaiellales bacterium]
MKGFDQIARLDNGPLLIVTAPGRPPAGCLVGFAPRRSRRRAGVTPTS